MPGSVSSFRSRRLATGLIALVGAIAITVGSALAGAVVWAATTVLVVPGTGTKNPAPVTNYQENAVGYYVAPTGACAQGCTATPVPYIAEFWPIPLKGWGGLQGAKWDDSVASGVTSLNEVYGSADKTSPIVIFGYSQGGTVVSEVKRQLGAQPGGVPDNVSFVLIGNASRPNGGLFSRPSFLGHIPFLDVTFKPGTPTTTSTTVNTTDVAFQYDGVTDFPRYPVNLLATANALAGFWYVHGKYLTPKGDDPATATPIGYTPDEVKAAVASATANCTAATDCQVSGDTRYVTLPAKILPIMLPLLDLAAATGTTGLARPFVDLVSPVARVLIETGYSRDDYGRPTPFGLLPLVDPFKLTADLAAGVVQGVRAATTGTGDASKYLAPKPSTTGSDTVAPTATREDAPQRAAVSGVSTAATATATATTTKAAESTTDAAKTDRTTAAAATPSVTEQKPTTTGVAEAPKADATTDPTKVEAPKVETPKAEVPKVEVPKAEAPKSESADSSTSTSSNSKGEKASQGTGSADSTEPAEVPAAA